MHWALSCGDQLKCFLSGSGINSTLRGLSDPYSLCSSGQAARWSHISAFFHFVFPALDIHGIVFCLADLKGTEPLKNNLQENLLYVAGVNTVNLLKSTSVIKGKKNPERFVVFFLVF